MRGERHYMRAVAGVGLAAVFVVVASTAQASPSARLVYGRGAGGESCPDEAALRTAVSKRIGYDPFFPYAPRTVVVTIRQASTTATTSGSDRVARIEIVEDAPATGVREIVSHEASCDELFQSTALAIAIAIDPHALVGPTPTPAPAPSPSPSPSPSSPSSSGSPSPQSSKDEPAHPAARAAASSPAPREDATARDAFAEAARSSMMTKRDEVRAHFTFAPRVATGLQPGLAPGLAIGGAAVWRRGSIGAEVASYLPTSMSGIANTAVEGWVAHGSLLPCLRFEPMKVCGNISIGRFEGSGDRGRVAAAATDAGLFLAAGARAGVEVRASQSFRLAIDGDLLGNLYRSSLKVGSETVWRAPAVAFVLAAGGAFEF